MKIYVSGHNISEAKKTADALRARGHTLTSTWHDEVPILNFWSGLTDDQKSDRAIDNLSKVCDAHALVMLVSPDRVPGGKFIEAAYGAAYGLTVYLLGDRRENGVLWSNDVTLISSIDDIPAC